MTEFELVCDAAVSVLGIERNLIRPDSLLSADLGANSLDVYEILTVLGEKCALDLPRFMPDTSAVTVAELVKLLEAAGKEGTPDHE